MAVSGSLCLTLDVTWLWVALSGVRAQIKPPGNYWIYVNRVVSVRKTLRPLYLPVTDMVSGPFCSWCDPACRKVTGQVHCYPISSKSSSGM